MKEHLEKFRERILKEKVSGFLITNLRNIYYLVGFSGSSGLLLVRPDDAFFFTDFRYQEQVKREISDCKIKIVKDELLKGLAKSKEIKKRDRIGFESRNLSVSQYSSLKEFFPQVRWKPFEDSVETLRKAKDEEEIAKIKKAAAIGDTVFQSILSLLKPGISEQDIASEIDYRLKKAGASGSPFETIVASGSQGALPHASPTNRKLRQKDFIVIDLGAIYRGYCSDMTRTVILGRPSQKHKQIYHLVLKAQERALKFMRPGMKCAKVDELARSVIREAGFGREFGHGLGHGVGLEIHEAPSLSRKSKDTLEPGMVVTVEPGVYISGWGGVRIEDTILITKEGIQTLTKTPKEMIVV